MAEHTTPTKRVRKSREFGEEFITNYKYHEHHPKGQINPRSIPSEKSDLSEDEKILENIKSFVEKLSSGGRMTKESRALYHGIANAVLLGPNKVNQKYVRDRLGLGAGAVMTSMKKKGTELETKLVLDAKSSNKLPEEKEQEVINFFYENSHESSNVKDTILIRKVVNGEVVQEPNMKRFVCTTYTRLHQKFLEEKFEISWGTFLNLRPKVIHRITEAQRLTCMCSIHVKMMNCVRDWKKNRQSHSAPPLEIEHYSNIDKMSMCSEYTLKCVDRECDQCGIKLLNPILTDLEKDDFNETTFYKWEELKKDENGQLGALVVSGRPKEFIGYMKKLVHDYPFHRNIYHHQQDQTKALLSSLKENEIFLVRDFSERHSLVEKVEVQSLHWANKQATIHVTVAYYYLESQLCKEYIFVISDEGTQDWNLTRACDDISLKHIESRGISFSTIYLKSDRCAAQYCSRKVFGDTTFRAAEMNKTIHLIYSASGHGKGEVDAAGGIAKRKLTEKMLGGRPIRTPLCAAEALQEDSFFNTRHSDKPDMIGSYYCGSSTYYVGKDEIKKMDKDFKQVIGTQRIHHFMTNTKLKLFARKRLCICDNCRLGQFRICENYPDFREIVMEEKNSPISSPSEPSTSSIPPISAPSTRVIVQEDIEEISDLIPASSNLAALASLGNIVAFKDSDGDIIFVEVIQELYQAASHKVCKASGDEFEPFSWIMEGKILQKKEANVFVYKTKSPVMTFRGIQVFAAPLTIEKISNHGRGNQKHFFVSEDELDLVFNSQ